jgi:hypothetical protein
MMTPEQIETRDFSYVSAQYFRPAYACHHFVVGTPDRGQATERAYAYARANWGEPDNLFVYPRNYVRKARALYAQGLHD